MLSKLCTKVLPFAMLSQFKRPGFNLAKYSMSNRKSIEQQSYFDSRSKTYDKHTYPHYKPTTSVSHFLQKYSGLKHVDPQSPEAHENMEKVVGRISSIRKHGKTTFIDIREDHLKLQVTIKTEK